MLHNVHTPSLHVVVLKISARMSHHMSTFKYSVQVVMLKLYTHPLWVARKWGCCFPVNSLTVFSTMKCICMTFVTGMYICVLIPL